MQKIRDHFLKWRPRVFVIVTVFTLMVTDLLNCWYLKLYWEAKNYSSLFVRLSLARSGLGVGDFNPDTLKEMMGFLNNTFNFFLLIILVNNFFFYFFYLRKRLWAQSFVAFYTMTAGLFSLTLLFDTGGLGATWFTYNLFTIPLYLYLFFGVRALKPETTIDRRKNRR